MIYSQGVGDRGGELGGGGVSGVIYSQGVGDRGGELVGGELVGGGVGRRGVLVV